MLQLPYAQYGLGASQAQNNGNLDMVTSMATTARDSLNGLISAVAGEGRTAFVSNLDGTLTDQRYGHRGNDLYIKFGAGGAEEKQRLVNGVMAAFTSADQVVEYGALRAIRNTKIVGGDIFAKRAIARSPAADLTSLAGDLQIASDYGFYASNRELVNGLIKGAYPGFNDWEQQHFANSKTVVDKVSMQGLASLDANERSYWDYWNGAANGIMDRYVRAVEDQSLANPWIITLQRVSELQLDKWAPSDFYGGLRGFLDSFDLAGRGIGYDQIATSFDGSNPTFSANAAGAKADGLFDILLDPQQNGRAARVDNFGANVGYTVMASTGASTESADFYSNVSPTYHQSVDSRGGDDIIALGQAGDWVTAGAGWDWVDGREGNDTLHGGDHPDVMLGGAGSDRLLGEWGDDFLSGGDGADNWHAAPDAGLWGFAGNDTLVGGGGTDYLYGEDGDDTLIVDPDGGNTWDHLEGGAGQDTASFERFTQGVYVDFNTVHNSPWAGGRSQHGDGFISVENITGSEFNDNLWGSNGTDQNNGVSDPGQRLSGNNRLRGLGGDDRLEGMGGTDTLEGGAGADYLHGWGDFDWVSYENSPDAVNIDLTLRTASGGDAEGDHGFHDVEHVYGSRYGDELKGNGWHSQLWGLAGDDWLVHSGAGQWYNGGEGFDTVDFSTATAAITITNVNTSGQVLGVVQGTRGADGARFEQIEGFVGSAFADSMTGSAAAETFEGGKGNDTLNGGDGLDTYIFNRGDGRDVINDERNKGAIISFGPDVKFSQLVAGLSGGLTLSLDGTTDRVTINNFFMQTAADKNIGKVLDMNGAGQLDISEINHSNSGRNTGVYVDGSYQVSGSRKDLLLGHEYNNIIRGHTNNSWEQDGNVIIGGTGNDYIYTSGGDDQFAYDIGDGIDYIDDEEGVDTLVLGSTIAAEDVVVTLGAWNDNNLYIDFRDPASTTGALIAGHRIIVVDGAISYYDGGPSWKLRGIEHIMAGGAWIDLAKLDLQWHADTVADTPCGNVYDPIVFDLGGDGLNLTSVAHSSVVSRTNDYLTRVGWVGASDGMLAVDRNGDGRIDRSSELMFAQDNPGSVGDLQGLEAWDSNADGKLDATDTRFGELLMWVDSNQNGRSTPDELRTLAQAGVASLTLGGALTGSSTRMALDNVVTKTTAFTRTDGTTGDAYEVALARRFLHADGLEAASETVGWAEVQGEGEFGRLLNDAAEKARGKKGGETLKEALGLEKKTITYAEAAAEVQVDFSDTSKDFSKAEVKWAEKELKRAEKVLAKLADVELLELGLGDASLESLANFGQGRSGGEGSIQPLPLSNLDNGGLGGQASRTEGSTAADEAANLLLSRKNETPAWDSMSFALGSSGSPTSGSSWWRSGSPSEGSAQYGPASSLATPTEADRPFAATYRAVSQETDQQRFRQAMAAFNGDAGAGVAVWRRSGELSDHGVSPIGAPGMGRHLDIALSRSAA